MTIPSTFIDRRRILTGGLALGAALSSRAAWAAIDRPFKMFDAHAHFVSDDTTKYPMYGLPAAPPRAPTAAPVSPTFPQPSWPMSTADRLHSQPTTAERMFAWWDANGVESGCGVQYRTAYGVHNDYMLATADAHPDRVAPIVILDATDEQTPAQLHAWAKSHGIAGIRITGPAADTAWLDSPQAKRTWAAANELGLVVVVMYQPLAVSPSSLNKLAALAGAYPNVDLVLDHIGWPDALGGPNFGLLPEHAALAAHKNAYYKFTTMNLNALDGNKISTSAFLRHAVDTFGADHILWGSDVGNSPGPYDVMVNRVVESTAKLTLAERRQVLRDTGRKVFVRGGRHA